MSLHLPKSLRRKLRQKGNQSPTQAVEIETEFLNRIKEDMRLLS